MVDNVFVEQLGQVRAGDVQRPATPDSFPAQVLCQHAIASAARQAIQSPRPGCLNNIKFGSRKG
jgi:hypothetical protein